MGISAYEKLPIAGPQPNKNLDSVGVSGYEDLPGAGPGPGDTQPSASDIFEKAAKVGMHIAMLSPGGVPAVSVPETAGPALKSAGSDIGGLLTDVASLNPYGSTGPTPNAIAALEKLSQGVPEELKEQVRQFINKPGASLVAAGYALGAQPMQDAFESLTGISAETLKPLSVEERAAAIKGTAANATAIALGAGAETALPEVKASGSIMAKMARNATVAAAAGAGQGSVLAANTPDEFTDALSSAFVYGTFGAIHGVFKGILDVATGKSQLLKTQAPAEVASEIEQLKQLEVTTRESLAQGVANAAALNGSQSIPEAVLRGTLALDPNVTHIMPNVQLTPEITDLLSIAREANVSVETRVTSNGTLGDGNRVDFLFPKEGTNVEMWKRTGYLPNQRVSMNGVEYSVVGEGTQPNTIQLMHDDGTKVTVPLSAIKDIPGKSFTSPAIAERTPRKSTIPIQYTQKDIDEFQKDVLPRLNKGEKFEDIVDDMGPHKTRAMLALYESMAPTHSFDVLARVANTNGMMLDHQDGAFVLRDGTTGQQLAKLNTPEQVNEFISKSGQHGGEDQLGITGNGGADEPPNVTAHNSQGGQFNNNSQAPYTPQAMGGLERFLNSITRALPWYTDKYDWMLAMDKWAGTNIATKVGIPIRDAWMKWSAQAAPWNRKVEIIDKLLSKTSPMRRTEVGGYLETMSIPEMEAETNTYEKETARWLADKKIDIDKVYNHMRTILNLTEQLGSSESDALKDQVRARLLDLGQGFTRDELGAVARFMEIRNMPLEKASLFKTTRLARAYQNPATALSQADYAKVHNLTPTELQATKLLQQLYGQLGDEFNISDARRITQYMNHYREYGDIPREVTNPLKKQTFVSGSYDPQKFISDLVRSGEINNYISDPVQALVRYIRAGYMSKSGFNDIYAQARNDAIEEIKKLPQGSQRAAAKVLNEYLDEARGIPNAGDQLMQEALEPLLKQLGIKVPVRVRGDIVNGLLSLTNSAMLGFKPELGFRDFGVWVKMYYSRFGAERTLAAIKAAFEVDPETGMSMADKYVLDGKIAGLSPVDIFSSEELTRMQSRSGLTNKLIAGAEKLGQTGLNVSGQANFYKKIHAGAYSETYRLAAKNLYDLGTDKITKEQAYKNLDIDSYDAPIAQRFDDLVTHGQYQEAADFLGRTTAAETGFIHGFGQHPYGWGSNIGRLLGQFGTFPVWERNYLFRLASRGTPGARVARISRFLAAEAATKLAGATVGFNTSNWMMSYHLAFMGGPIVQNISTLPALFGQRGTKEQNDAISDLLNQFTEPGFQSMFIPGSSAFHDYAQAMILADKGYGAIPVLGKGLGFSVDQTGRSFLDDWTGNYPETKPVESPADAFLRGLRKVGQSWTGDNNSSRQ